MTPDPLLDLVAAALRVHLAADLGWGRNAGYALADVERLLPKVREAVEKLPDRASGDEPGDADLDDLLAASRAAARAAVPATHGA